MAQVIDERNTTEVVYKNVLESLIYKLQEKKELEVQNAIIELQNQNLKVSVSSISRLSGIDRKTVKKYYLT